MSFICTVIRPLAGSLALVAALAGTAWAGTPSAVVKAWGSFAGRPPEPAKIAACYFINFNAF